MPESGSKTSTVPVVWATSGIFSAQSIWFPVGRDWWPWTKPGYITMTQRQSNNHWSGSIVAHPAPKNSKCKNPLEKFSPQFFEIKPACSPLIIFQRAKLSMRSTTYLCWCNWRTFWRKNATGSSPRGVLFLHDNARAHWALETQKKLACMGFHWFERPPYYPDWLRWTTTCSMDWKNNWEVAIFCPTQSSLLLWRPGWMDFFLSG